MKKESIKLNFPKLKKKINAFLVGEEGKISKGSILKTSLALGTLGMILPSISAGTNNLSLGTYNPANGATIATHTSHGSHASHGSHGSHGSHCSGCSCKW